MAAKFSAALDQVCLELSIAVRAVTRTHTDTYTRTHTHALQGQEQSGHKTIKLCLAQLGRGMWPVDTGWPVLESPCVGRL